MGSNNKVGLITGLGLGAGLMYLFDPAKGRRRRGIAYDKARSIARRVSKSVDRTLSDIANRTYGLAPETQSLFNREAVPDWVLEARVRTALGRLVSNAHELEVTAKAGVIELRGPVLESESRRLLSGAGAIAGVTRVDDCLRLVRRSSDSPGARGSRAPRRLHLRSGHWPPATRFLVGGAGALLALSGIRLAGRRGMLGLTVALSGAGLLLRGASNKEVTRLLGLTSGVWEVDLRRTLHLAVPVEKAFEFWANYQNFPRFMAHLKEVRNLGNGRSHWIATGPASAPVEWVAEITRLEPNSLIEWQSVPVSTIETAGAVQFHSDPDGHSRLDIRVCFNPPAGSVGHLIGTILGVDPRRALSEDLQRLKSLIEVGKTTLHHAKITREELPGIAKTLLPAPAS